MQALEVNGSLTAEATVGVRTWASRTLIGASAAMLAPYFSNNRGIKKKGSKLYHSYKIQKTPKS